MDIFDNAWFVGIGGGILSGLIVTVITRYLFSKRDNNEYLQKVAAVNREIVYALRPGISEGHIPDEGVLVALANSTARKYRVSRSDIYQPKQIAEELIKEIMDSSFISSETKRNYCETLAHLVEDALPQAEAVASEVEAKIAENEYRQRFNERMSTVLGLTASIITMSFVYQRFLDKSEIGGPLRGLVELVTPTLTVLFSTGVAMASVVAVVRLKHLGESKPQ